MSKQTKELNATQPVNAQKPNDGDASLASENKKTRAAKHPLPKPEKIKFDPPSFDFDEENP
jgi:hypothetical protein